MSGGWAVTLDGVTLSGGSHPGDGCLTAPPLGLGLPGLRTEDVTYLQRDGVRMFSDWYEPRVITLEEVMVCPPAGGCDPPGACADVRTRVRDILLAWQRRCEDVELVIHTDCEGEGPPALVGPYGVRGRPRVAEVVWGRGPRACATLLLRFDAVDHRLFVLDETGEPGSGRKCVTLTPETTTRCRTYPRCYPSCYEETTGDAGGGPVSAWSDGTVCVGAQVTLCGRLQNPRVENITTGEWFSYRGTIEASDPCVIVDTAEGTASQGGENRSHLLRGDSRWMLEPGENRLRLTSFGAQDNGTAEVCYRDNVIMA